MASGNADTPRKAYITASIFATSPGDLKARREELRFTMHKKITCISFTEFMDEFLPDSTNHSEVQAQPIKSLVLSLRSSGPSSEPPQDSVEKPHILQNPFKGMQPSATERSMYTKITEALNAANPCPGYQFVPTPHKGDQSADTKQAVDCGMYPIEAAKKLKLEEGDRFGRMAWSWVEIAIECKMNSVSDDPFDEDLEGHEPNAETRRHVLGQILSYAEYVFNHQQRMFQYMLLFLGNCARIVRIDRAGIFATEKFIYRSTHGDRIVQFLRRYAALSLAERGHDTTALRLDPKSDDAETMRARVKDLGEDDYVGALFKKQLREDWPWWKLEVPDELTGHTRRYLVGKPHFQAPGVAGRATRGYVALEADPAEGQKARFFYLKDAWRVVSDDITKEGVVLQELRKHEVECVPTFVCHGDMLGQRTRTQEVWPKCHKGKECALKTHQHYRLVVKEVGKPLEEFSNGMELVMALLCCLTAHSDAYSHGIIHRDISSGNMLLYKQPDGTWTGLLNDWELSKELEQQEKEGRQPDRTGTWQFMSANALDDHSKVIDVPDELESFFHVLIYLAVRFLPHNLTNSSVPQFLRDYFDDYTPHAQGFRCGRTKAAAMENGRISLSAYNAKKEDQPVEKYLRFTWPTKSSDSAPSGPLDNIVTTLLSWFKAYYTYHPNKEAPVRSNEGITAVKLEFTGVMGRIRAKRKGDSEATPNAEGVHRPTEAASAAGTSTEATSSVMIKDPLGEAPGRLANKVKTHEAMINLLLSALEHEWPETDRHKELKPTTKWKPPVDQVPKGSKLAKDSAEGSKSLKSPKAPRKGSKVSSRSKVSTGSKRTSRDAGDIEAGPSSKRRKH
ncbi:hypothetical protein C8Q79DRAFT_911651 [Trametes meyenii]|nr:hypothetical protein C8Q79DRAFT_911651 [Trametes meyenii]